MTKNHPESVRNDFQHQVQRSKALDCRIPFNAQTTREEPSSPLFRRCSRQIACISKNRALPSNPIPGEESYQRRRRREASTPTKDRKGKRTLHCFTSDKVSSLISSAFFTSSMFGSNLTTSGLNQSSITLRPPEERLMGSFDALRLAYEVYNALMSVYWPIEMTKYQWYVVFMGRKAGIYDTWEDCHEQVYKYKGNCYQGFYTKEKALSAWKLDFGTPFVGPILIVLPKVKSNCSNNGYAPIENFSFSVNNVGVVEGLPKRIARVESSVSSTRTVEMRSSGIHVKRSVGGY